MFLAGYANQKAVSSMGGWQIIEATKKRKLSKEATNTNGTDRIHLCPLRNNLGVCKHAPSVPECYKGVYPDPRGDWQIEGHVYPPALLGMYTKTPSGT